MNIIAQNIGLVASIITIVSYLKGFKAPIVFEDLIKTLNCSYIAVSYNNTYTPKSNSSKNKITLEQIESILKFKGETKVYDRSHKYFNTGKTEFNNHKEFLFITKVN